MLTNEKLNSETNCDGFIRVYNNGGFVAFFAVAYTLNGKHVIEVSPEFPVLQSETIIVPRGAVDVAMQASVAVYIQSWKDLPIIQIMGLPRTCFSLTGTVFNPACTMISCPQSSTSNSCCNSGCSNNILCNNQ